MTYEELIKKANQLITEGKSKEEIFELMQDDVKLAAECTARNPESLKEIQNRSSGLLGSLLFALIGRTLYDIEMNKK